MIFLRALLVVILCSCWATLAFAGGPALVPEIPSYLITNDDRPPKIATSGTLFSIAADGTLHHPTGVNLGGSGAAGGYFASNRVTVVKRGSVGCAFLSLGASSEIGAVDLRSQQDIGNFPAASTDSGIDNGIGLAHNGTYLYTSFSTSNTIATFAIQPGCGLQFLGDISLHGKHQGSVKGMAVHNHLMVVTYGEGSIESFNVAAGIPVSNGDLQDATGYATDGYANGVDITQDGRYAIFGDMSVNTTVEVSAIHSGKLTKTVLYVLGPAGNSNNVLLSPDESLLYVANTGTGQVTAAFFDKNTGKISRPCTSTHLRGFDTDWTFMSSPVTQLNSGTGSVLYVAEFGNPSSIAMVNVASSGGRCTLTEGSQSPVVAPNTASLLSIGVYPPRVF
jgi:6-phosphogluconolactonase (cycloisomerase 2 family)